MSPVISASIVCLAACWSAPTPPSGSRPEPADALRYRFFKDIVPVAASEDRVLARGIAPGALEARLALHGAALDPEGFAAPGWIALRRSAQNGGP